MKITGDSAFLAEHKRRQDRDGECFVYVTTNSDGTSDAVFVDPDKTTPAWGDIDAIGPAVTVVESVARILGKGLSIRIRASLFTLAREIDALKKDNMQ